MLCQQCGKYNPDSNSFCDYCQAPLSEGRKENTVSPALIGLFLSCIAFIISIVFFIKVIVPLPERNNINTLFTAQIGKEGI